ncbi:hypothetical protein F511_00349 [Dorcoceras hygrometricum]|nr:hypothetical protein F511_00349 [Dorcoceras hygrometricum]
MLLLNTHSWEQTAENLPFVRWERFESIDDSGYVSEKGRPLPKFGEWDVNDPASAEGFTVIFNKARNEKKTGGKPESPSKMDLNARHGVEPLKTQGVSFMIFILQCLLARDLECMKWRERTQKSNCMNNGVRVRGQYFIRTEKPFLLKGTVLTQ